MLTKCKQRKLIASEIDVNVDVSYLIIIFFSSILPSIKYRWKFYANLSFNAREHYSIFLKAFFLTQKKVFLFMKKKRLERYYRRHNVYPVGDYSPLCRFVYRKKKQHKLLSILKYIRFHIQKGESVRQQSNPNFKHKTQILNQPKRFTQLETHINHISIVTLVHTY